MTPIMKESRQGFRSGICHSDLDYTFQQLLRTNNYFYCRVMGFPARNSNPILEAGKPHHAQMPAQKIAFGPGDAPGKSNQGHRVISPRWRTRHGVASGKTAVRQQ